MERVRCKSIHNKYYYKGSHSIQFKTPFTLPVNSNTKEIFHKGISKYVNNSPGLKGEGNSRGSSGFEFRIPFQDVLSKEVGRRIPPNLRLEGTQQICSDKAFSASISDRGSRFPPGKRLDGKDRSSAGLFSFAHSRIAPSISESVLQWPGTAVNSPTLWPVFSPSNFCSFSKLDRGDPSVQRHPSLSLFGRLHSGEPGQNQADESGLGDTVSSGKSRLACQLQKVCACTVPGTGISGLTVEYPQQYHGPTCKEDNKSIKHTLQNPRKRTFFSSGNSVLARALKLCQPNHTERALALSTHSAFSKMLPPQQAEERSSPSSAAGANLVAEGHTPQFGGAAQERGDPLFNHRRSGCGLGGTPQRQLSVRKMVSPSESLAFKRKGDVCGIRGNSSSEDESAECTHLNSNGQQNSGSAYQKRGWNSFTGSPRTDHEANGNDRALKYHAFGGVPSGKVQRHCRPPVQKPSSAGMALVTPGLGGCIQSLGHTRGRLVCIKKERRRRTLRKLGLQRWFSNLLRRIQSTVELQVGLGVPTTQSNSTSIKPPQHSSGHIHCDSSAVDSVFLADGSTGKSSGRALTDKRPTSQSDRSDYGQDPSSDRKAKSPCLESWGWASQIAHWSLDERDLLKKSWRESTLATYKAPIRRWTLWCESHNVNPRVPQGNDVARFLARLFIVDKLAYRTILLHKSAVSTYCAGGSEDLSKNFFVHQVLKAISLATPQERKSPIWDTKLIFDWLKNETITDTVFDIARRTAIILLLASGRRVHDLTLLDLSKDNFIEKHNELILWPRFGSKTDNASSRQSGWLLREHPIECLCPVRHVKKLMQATESRRSESNITNLFLTITGVVKPASRTMIAGWIKSILKEAGIDAPPGSVRSAVASRSWLENRPIKEILERANWKSAKTFQKFYCRQINSESIENEDLLLNHFSNI